MAWVGEWLPTILFGLSLGFVWAAHRNWVKSKVMMQQARDHLDSAKAARRAAEDCHNEVRESGRVLIEKMTKTLVSAEVHAAGGCDCEDEDSHKETN